MTNQHPKVLVVSIFLLAIVANSYISSRRRPGKDSGEESFQTSKARTPLVRIQMTEKVYFVVVTGQKLGTDRTATETALISTTFLESTVTSPALL
jgi:hypothetical protein